jgi:predicted RNA binding protein YcfA (HicA-like mRNA interferase family)
MPSDTSRRIVKLAESYGFKLIRQKRHLIFKHSSGKVLTTSLTCSDRRALKNVEATIKNLLANHDSNHSG